MQIDINKFRGVLVALVTPFDSKNGPVDVYGLSRLVEFLIESGVNGFYPIGTTGEGLLLSMAEKKFVIEKVMDLAAGRAIVIPQIGSLSFEDTIELGRFARDLGVDGVGVLPPIYYSIPSEEIVTYFLEIAQVLDPLPIFLYNIPSNAKNDITPAIAESISSEAPNVIGIKDTSKDIGRFESYIATMGSDFAVIVGADALFFPSLTVGGYGTVTAAGNAIPELFVQLYNAYQNTDWAMARDLQYRINQVRAVIKSGPAIASYKAALRLRGVPVSGMRSPFRDVTAEEFKTLEAKMRSIGFVQ
jgi:4-hydroxy-tetrahydrodipicolinate synthase